MLEFILARYNYWIVIALMMTGLYIVFSRGNLVKTLIGLNLFQTSVFIFYITVSKVIGGTAPILIEEKGAEGHGEGHGGEATHGSTSEAPVGFYTDRAAGHLEEGYGAKGDAALHAGEAHDLPLTADGSGHLDNHVAPPIETGASHDAAGHAAEIIYSNPLPHVLILTAIVVGVATTAVGLSLAVRIREAYGTVEEDDLVGMDDAEENLEAVR
jgi:multicomponent Na+:H+ antiporter subunit C